MLNQSMLKPGDVVLGSFATKDRVLNHHSVVLMANEEGCMLAYTTSLKDKSSQCSQRFSAEDMMSANWSNPCRWDGSVVSVVPTSRVRKTGRISKKTLGAIMAAYQKAVSCRTVQCVMLSPSNEVVVA